MIIFSFSGVKSEIIMRESAGNRIEVILKGY